MFNLSCVNSKRIHPKDTRHTCNETGGGNVDGIVHVDGFRLNLARLLYDEGDGVMYERAFVVLERCIRMKLVRLRYIKTDRTMFVSVYHPPHSVVPPRAAHVSLCTPASPPPHGRRRRLVWTLLALSFVPYFFSTHSE